VPPNARAACQSISIGVVYATAFITPLIYYPLNQAIGGLAMMMFIAPLGCLTLYCYRRLPETRGRNPDMIAFRLNQIEPVGMFKCGVLRSTPPAQPAWWPVFEFRYDENLYTPEPMAVAHNTSHDDIEMN
jgi:hypothetical protein